MIILPTLVIEMAHMGMGLEGQLVMNKGEE